MLINGKQYYYDVGRQKHVTVMGGEVKIIETPMLQKELFVQCNGDERLYKQHMAENFMQKIEIRDFKFDPHEGDEFERYGFPCINTYKKTTIVSEAEALRDVVNVQDLHRNILFLEKYPHINRLLDNLFTTTSRKEYFINWLATALVTRRKNRTAIVVRGAQGTGKGLLWEQIIEYAVGTEYCSTISNDDLTTNFNSALENKLFILANEIKGDFRDGNSMYEKLKMYVTDDELRVEQKRVDSRKVKNYFNVFLASNNTTPLQIQSGDRRYTVYETADTKIKDVGEKELGLTIEQFIKKIKEERNDFIKDLFMFDYDANRASQCQETDEKERIYRASVTKSDIISEKIKQMELKFFENDIQEIIDTMSEGEFFSICDKYGIVNIDGSPTETLRYAVGDMFASISTHGHADNKYFVFFYSLFTGEVSPQKIGTALTAHFGSSKTGRVGDGSKVTRVREVKINHELIPF